jgi:hypothetical protein
LEESGGITGCAFAEKINFRISIWISDQSHANSISTAWKHVIGTELPTPYYSSHTRSSSNESKYKKNSFKNKGKF